MLRVSVRSARSAQKSRRQAVSYCARVQVPCVRFDRSARNGTSYGSLGAYLAMKPMVTLFTDAGHCPDILRGTWVCWAKYDGPITHRHSGIIKPVCDNSTVAEIYAICNGFCSAVAFFKPAVGTLVLIQSDSTGALAAYQTQQNSAPVRTLAQRAAEHGLRCAYRHVKGHNKASRQPRSAVNAACDQRCTELLAVIRTQLGWRKISQELC
jgi:hypothetical protein